MLAIVPTFGHNGTTKAPEFSFESVIANEYLPPKGLFGGVAFTVGMGPLVENGERIHPSVVFDSKDQLAHVPHDNFLPEQVQMDELHT
jgi:hypothetical protein